MTDAQIRVIAAVISRGERLLVCKRPLSKRHGGLWEFPGGKCEPGESDFGAAQRELLEELGVNVTTVGREEFLILDYGSPFQIAFVPVTVEGEPTCREHLALSWELPENLLSYSLAPSDRRYVAFRLGANEPEFSAE